MRLNQEITDKINQYCFIKNELYKKFYITEEKDRGMFVCETEFEDSIFLKFKSIGLMGKKGPLNHVGERACFRLYFHSNGLVELLFENNGYVDEVKDFKHLIYLLDPKNLDLLYEI